MRETCSFVGIRRAKRRAIALVAAGAAGAAAAYYAYTWCSYYFSNTTTASEDTVVDTEHEGIAHDGREDSKEEFGKGSSSCCDSDVAGPSGVQDFEPSVLIDPTEDLNGRSQQDIEAHLQHHFDSIQMIALDTTLPSLLPTVAKFFSAADDSERLLEQLRKAKEGSVVMSYEEKLQVWKEMTELSLARLIIASWTLPLLTLQVSIQLNILGRHLYLETALKQHQDSRRTLLHRRFAQGEQDNRGCDYLSVPSQEAFLSLSEHLGKSGLQRLFDVGRQASASALADCSLDKPLGAQELLSIFSAAQAEFVQRASRSGWSTFLLPPPEMLTEVLRLQHPDDRALMPNAENQLVDAEAVEDMARELKAIVESERFHDVAVVSLFSSIVHEIGFGCGRKIMRWIAL